MSAMNDAYLGLCRKAHRFKIPFKLTYNEYVALWDGQFAKRTYDYKQVRRINLNGPFSVENCRVETELDYVTRIGFGNLPKCDAQHVHQYGWRRIGK